MKKSISWHEFLIEKLVNQEKALSYLQVSLEGYLIDGDVPFFLKGIRNVVEAQGGVPAIAEQAGLSPDTLSKFLFSEGPLNFGTLSTLLKTFGWKLSIEPLTAEDYSHELANQQLTASNESLETTPEQVVESLPA